MTKVLILPLAKAEEGELSNVGEAEGLASEEEQATEMMVVKWLMKGRVAWLARRKIYEVPSLAAS